KSCWISHATQPAALRRAFVALLLVGFGVQSMPSLGQTLTNLTMSPTTIASGQTATGTVTLSAAAPTGGISVCLATNTAPVISIPSSVTVAQGSTTGNFTINWRRKWDPYDLHGHRESWRR